MLTLDLIPQQQELVERTAVLGREHFKARAAHYDDTATFPAEDFDDLFHAGLHAAAVPKAYGGFGLGPYHDDVFTLWMMTKEIAKADLSLARCWEGHVNSLVLLDGLANEAQKARWFEGVVQRGEKWVAWSGEPQSRAPGQQLRFGTTVEKVDGGYIVDGTKVFSTSAGGVEWAILLVNTAGPGGARHATEAAESLLLLACDLSDSTVTFDGSWWDPIGMRATVSHLVHFDRTFIPDSHLIGAPGQYLQGGWQTCFTPHYAASFLGAAEAAYTYALEYLTTQNKGHDPYVQQHIGQMAINVETAHLWLRHVARLWETGCYDEAQLAGSRARFFIEELAEETVKRCIRACGARSLNRPGPLERIYRDLSFYVRHDNADHILATIGKSQLGQAHDGSFFTP
ncbi:MAG: acyl-CoA dehydrogenase [Candidatus Entotheonella gemina]|uniref:Acyl-CoA dehydrogenase n=1 Tax=Candidatus Entotheonella gemina TaxID=1429439 RepID=W4M0W8_9BACT|nr:MAG: acyl-CoA dehydrogenase [Candidatus Entotheonella gemina]